ncbi:MAG: hypothetical protein R3C05_20420 [Pirellulaceae bacterium]
MSTTTQEPFRSYRVPREHGTWLIEPSLDKTPDVLMLNQHADDRANVFVCGEPIESLRRSARRELFEAAISYVRQYRDLPDACATCSVDQPFILAGHQPELFHPGVWFKNFVLSRLGQSLSATTVNLIVDNDVCRSRSIRVPTLRDGQPASESIPMDRPGQIVPYEMARITDRDTFDAFGRNVARAVSPWIRNPCIGELWPTAKQAAERTNNLGLSLAQARHQLEAAIGLSTLELPVSRMSETAGFMTFVLHLISDLPRLHACYNESIVRYRGAHRIRSSSHPVPELSRREQYWEAPLWIYDHRNPQRRALFVKATATAIELSDLDRIQITIPWRQSVSDTVNALRERLGREIFLRPRALVTTMYARLILSDLFLHGIGGGKYDQLNDTIIRRFFGIQPPQFMVLSATFTPLVDHIPPSDASSNAIRQSIRRTYFQPEHFIDDADLPVEELHEKHDLLSEVPPRGAKKAWHDRLTAINRGLSNQLTDVRRDLIHQMHDAQRREAERRLLASRDYSFCIYPQDAMVRMFGEIG